MHIKSAKTIALKQGNFALEKFTYRRASQLWAISLALTERGKALFLRPAHLFGPDLAAGPKSMGRWTSLEHGLTYA
jgi:hypothetical protein